MNHQGSPIMVAKLKSKLKDVNADSVSKLSSLWVEPGSWHPGSHCPAHGQSQSMWAELSCNCGV